MSNYTQFKKSIQKKRAIATTAIVALVALNVSLASGIFYVGGRMEQGAPLFDQDAFASILPTGTSASTGSSPIDSASTETVPSDTTSQDQTAPDATTAPSQDDRGWNTLQSIEPTLTQEMLAADARMLALPSNGVVSTEYFRSTLFIGDSITQGLALYADTQKTLANIATIAGFKGTGPKQIVENNVGSLPDQTQVPMWDFICQQTPMNIYVMLGTNTMVSSTDGALLKYYGDLLDALRTQFPNIPIYVQSILPITAAKSAENPNLTNDRIRLLNNAIAQIAVQRGMYYVNLHEVMETEIGDIHPDYVWGDGMHLTPDGYGVWIDYLSKHTAYNPYNEQFTIQPYHG